MSSLLFKLAVLIPMLVGLPLLGVAASGRPLAPYLMFPPLTRRVEPASFYWPAFLAVALAGVLVVGPVVLRLVRARPAGLSTGPVRPFPWWGWVGLSAGAGAWVLAWTRMGWFSAWQMHTFTPLWLAYIVVVNALTFRRTGRCMMLNRPAYFLALFPLSALFWWFFEFLNRFVRNWHYVGGVSDLAPWQYVLFATIPFATVLPAVLGTQELLLASSRFRSAAGSMRPIRLPRGRWIGGLILGVAASGLAGIAVLPDLLYPLLWVAPLLIVLGVQTLLGEETLLDALRAGRWDATLTAAAAALVCGFFWEMWNVASLAKWKYTIPYLHGMEVFEMPILGYLGYLPFGLQCLVAGDLARSVLVPGRSRRVVSAAADRAYDARAEMV